VAGGTTVDDTKKAVCKAFTSVVRGSALPIDPKAFFMMVTTNYAMLVQDKRLDLSPLWDAMASAHAPEQLHGVFLMFRLKAMDLGLKVLLPGPVDRLSEDQMRAAMQPWTGVMLPDEPTPYDPLPYEPLPLQLNTNDIRPFIPEELRRKIVAVVSSAIRTSPIGTRFDAAKLTFEIDSAFESLFDGRAFDFAQVIDALRETEVLADQEVYRAVARAKIDLTAIGIDVVEPQLALNTQEKQNIIDEMRRSEERAARERATGSIPPQNGESAPPAEASATPKRTTRDEQLEKYGLSSVREEKRSFPFRIVAMVVVLLAIGVAWFLTRPNRELDHLDYDKIMPMTHAELIDGTFQCTIDDSRWFNLKPEQREERLAKFESMLLERGLVEDMQCRDKSARLVITAAGPNKITGAAFFLRGDASGTISKPDSIADRKP
jgi:hypothetical protein